VSAGGAGVLPGLRLLYQDAPMMTDQQWCKTRLYAFMQRPNAQVP